MVITMNTKNFKGLRTLKRIPEYLKDVSLGKNPLLVEFNSLSAYKKFCTDEKDFDDCTQTSSMKYSDWSGSKTYDDFLDILDKGDDNVMSMMKDATGKEVAILAKKYEEEIAVYKFDVSGQFFDVGLVLTGVPETWLEPEIEEKEKVQVEINIDGAFNAWFNKDKIVKAGSRILAMVKLLEELDVQVKLRIISGNEGYNTARENLYVSTLIKDFDEPINYKKVSALLSPTYHRRGTFKVIEYTAGHSIGDGYGYPKHDSKIIQLDDKCDIDRLEETLFKK